jgi:hypothetical protein
MSNPGLPRCGIAISVPQNVLLRRLVGAPVERVKSDEEKRSGGIKTI